MANEVIEKKHTITQQVLFALKVHYFTLKRCYTNFKKPVTKCQKSESKVHWELISESISELWNESDTAQNKHLTAGKIQNLRIAASYFQNCIVEKNSTFSFWKQLGKPTKRKGFVVGREIREGCLTPTIAGGLCQLSNALYDAALKAHFTIVERHKHTKIVTGSLAEINRDATVKWNYVDLQFRSENAFQILIEFTDNKMMVRFVSKKTTTENSSEITPNSNLHHTLNDCYSCGNTQCSKHIYVQSFQAKTAYILDEKRSEFLKYIDENATNKDVLMVPFSHNKLFKNQYFNFQFKNNSTLLSFPIFTFYKILNTKFASKNKNVFQEKLRFDEAFAVKIFHTIPIDCTHIVVSQNLLPFLQKNNAFAGRTYDVMMTRFPIQNLQTKLDSLVEKYPKSTTINDFRTSQSLIDYENTALQHSRNIITSHTEIATVFPQKTKLISWNFSANQSITLGSKILFPASALARKGAFEVHELANEFGLHLSILGNSSEYNSFWNGISTEKFNGNWSEIGLILFPTHIEHNPKVLLKAISLGIPIITTKHVGLPNDLPLVFHCEAGNYASLRAIFKQNFYRFIETAESNVQSAEILRK